MIAALAATLLAAAAPADTGLPSLRPAVARMEAATGGTMGVAVIDLRTGERWTYRGNDAFPMQSVFKLPLAIAVLRRVDAGTLRLDARVRVDSADLRPFHSPLAEAHRPGGAAYTVRELLRYAVEESDNTAADVLFRFVGGPAGLTRELRALGIGHLRVDSGESALALRFTGVAPGPGRETRAGFERAVRSRTPAQLHAAMEAYVRDPRDTATPEDAAALLELLAGGRLLSRESAALLTGWMTETKTGPNRLRALLPPGATVAHKTGTARPIDGIAVVVNDIGIVTAPGGRRYAIAAFVKHGTRGNDAAERAIAQVSRAVYDHFAARR